MIVICVLQSFNYRVLLHLRMGVNRFLSQTAKDILRNKDSVLKNVSFWTNKRCFSSEAKESKVAVDGININYVKVGSGPKPVLCLPGVLGSIWSDFKPQVENLDRTKLTVIAWEPPGYGNSRPPNREFPRDFYHRDAEYALKFMKALSINKFSMLGWSDGGISAMILASKYPDNVDKLVVWGSNAYVTEEEAKIYESMRDISKWSERMKNPLIKLYGEDGLAAMWSEWTDTLVWMCNSNNGDICKDCLSKILCPTLIVHGKKDPLLAAEHPEYLLKHIQGSKLHIFDDGKHNLHLKYAKEFNALVTEFFTK